MNHNKKLETVLTKLLQGDLKACKFPRYLYAYVEVFEWDDFDERCPNREYVIGVNVRSDINTDDFDGDENYDLRLVYKQCFEYLKSSFPIIVREQQLPDFKHSKIKIIENEQDELNTYMVADHYQSISLVFSVDTI